MSGFFPADDAVMRIVGTALSGVAERQRVIADNIANSATPGYRSRSVAFESSLADAVRRGSLAGHAVTVADRGNLAKQDGNSVNMTEEVMELDQASLTFDALVQAMNFRISSVKAALAR